MLSDQERRHIQQEEVASARAELERRRAEAHQKTLAAYRQDVRRALRPRRRTAVLGVGALTVLTLAGIVLLRAASATDPPDDTSGGVASSVLMDRCEAELRARAGQEELQFSSRRQAAQEISASPDGKRWDGSFSRRSGAGSPERTDFSCVYTVATGQLTTELIAP